MKSALLFTARSCLLLFFAILMTSSAYDRTKADEQGALLGPGAVAALLILGVPAGWLLRRRWVR